MVALQASLAALGCALVVRSGSTPAALLDVVVAVGAEAVYAEDEVEERWLCATRRVQADMPSSIVLRGWRAPIWNTASCASGGSAHAHENVRVTLFRSKV